LSEGLQLKFELIQENYPISGVFLSKNLTNFVCSEREISNRGYAETVARSKKKINKEEKIPIEKSKKK